MQIPFSRPSIGEDEIQEVVECLRSGWITTGPRTARFEAEVAAYVGARHALAVTSGTAGLHLAMMALDLQPGDEVITTPMTWPTTVNTILLCGGEPVLVDIEDDTLNLDTRRLEATVTSRTRAIVPVHYAGQACDMDAIGAVAARHRLRVVDDAAHALGSEFRGRRIGSIGDASVFSFHPIKNITTAEGGMITTDDDELAQRLRLLRFHGVERDAWKAYGKAQLPRYDVAVAGLKYNMTDLQSSLGIHQLRKLDEFIARREALARRYDEAFADLPLVRPLGRAAYSQRHAHHLYVIRVDTERLRIDRDAFMAALLEAGIGIGLHFTAIHELTYYRKRLGDLSGALPVATRASRQLFSLPLYPSLSEADVDRVAATVREIARRNR